MKTVLWSGGLDSTILVAYLAQKVDVEPIYLDIKRTFTNPQLRIVRELCPQIQRIFSRVKDVTILRPWQWEFPKRPKIQSNRNLRMCDLMKELGWTDIWLGIINHPEGFEFHMPIEDRDARLLSELSGIRVNTWMSIDENIDKLKATRIGRKILGDEILDRTWSCQMTFKEPCRLCWSCIEREYVLKEVRKNDG